MISFQQIRRFFVTMILTIMLAITIAFDFGTTNSWAGTLPPQIATMNRVEAMTTMPTAGILSHQQRVKLSSHLVRQRLRSRS